MKSALKSKKLYIGGMTMEYFGVLNLLAPTQLPEKESVQILKSSLSARQYPAITVQGGPVKWIIDAPEGSITGCSCWMGMLRSTITVTA